LSGDFKLPIIHGQNDLTLRPRVVTSPSMRTGLVATALWVCAAFPVDPAFSAPPRNVEIEYHLRPNVFVGNCGCRDPFVVDCSLDSDIILRADSLEDAKEEFREWCGRLRFVSTAECRCAKGGTEEYLWYPVPRTMCEVENAVLGERRTGLSGEVLFTTVIDGRSVTCK
jgi:hypothetical protein